MARVSIVRWNLKEAGDKTWTRRTEIGYQAYVVGNPAIDGDAQLSSGNHAGKSDEDQGKETELTQGGLSLCLVVYPDYQSGNALG